MNEGATLNSWEEAVLWLRAQPDRQDLVSAAYYDDPLEAAASRYWHSDEWCAIKPFLPVSAGTALDVGAGRGIASYALAQEGFHVSALEPNPSSLVGAAAIRELAASAELPIDVTEEYSEKLPFPDCSFDVVFARAVLHHTSDLGEACREFLRVLRPGGCLIAVREHVISREEDKPAFFDAHPLHGLYGGENAFKLDAYASAITSAGLILDRVLAPFDSAINFAPYSLASLQDEIASRLTRRFPAFKAPLARLLRSEPAWRVVRPVLSAVDHRPGRLYSFVAHRP